MFRAIQPRAGFGWAVRAIAFVILGTLCITLIILGRREQPKPAKRRTFKTLFAFSALKEPRFLAFTVSLLFIFLGFYIPLFYVPLYAQYSLKTSENLAYNLVAVVNAGSFFGRILPFLIKAVPPVYNLTFWTAVSALLLFCWIAIHNVAGFIVWTVLYGAASGVIISASPSVVAHKTLCPDITNIGSRLGLSWAFAALGILIGTPIAGAGVDIARADFLVGQTFSGAMMAVGVLLLLVPTWAVFRYKEPEAERRHLVDAKPKWSCHIVAVFAAIHNRKGTLRDDVVGSEEEWRYARKAFYGQYHLLGHHIPSHAKVRREERDGLHRTIEYLASLSRCMFPGLSLALPWLHLHRLGNPARM
nr:aspyridones efflux protein apdf [Quercus suber]